MFVLLQSCIGSYASARCMTPLITASPKMPCAPVPVPADDIHICIIYISWMPSRSRHVTFNLFSLRLRLGLGLRLSLRPRCVWKLLRLH
jgi:hypothetical protein